MSNVMPHPDPETLLSFLDDDLPAAESRLVGDHLRDCDACCGRAEALKEALGAFDRFHRDVLKPSLPPPPRVWTLPEPARRRVLLFRPARWVAAAAIAAAVLVVYRFEFAPEVRAAQLLRKAAAAEQAAPAARTRIRIHGRTRTLDRPARFTPPSAPESSDEAAVHALFDAAGYNWDDPLSVASFQHWRDRQPEKRDRIDETPDTMLIQTSTPTGALADAALTLRATDLHAVACTLRFRAGETIGMSEIPAETPAPPPIPHLGAKAAAIPELAPDPDDELRVVAALHAIGADLGEAVEVERGTTRILVRVTGLTAARRQQIRVALTDIPAAQMQFEDVRPEGTRPALPPARSSAPTARASPQIDDQLLDATDHAIERAYALRALAHRFPPGGTPRDTAALTAIVRDHATALAAALQDIAPVDQVLPPAKGPWQSIAEALPDEIERLDQTLNGTLDASPARKAALIRQLQSQAAALRNP